MNWRGHHQWSRKWAYDRSTNCHDGVVFLIARTSREERWTVLFQCPDEHRWKYSARVSGLIVGEQAIVPEHPAHSTLQCEGDFFQLTSFDSYPAAQKLCRDIYYNRERS